MCRCVGGQGARTPPPQAANWQTSWEGGWEICAPNPPSGPKGTPSSFPHRHKHTPPPSSGRAGGMGANGRPGVSFHIRRWNTVYLGSEAAAIASPRVCSLLFLGDPRRRRGREGGRGREPPSPPQVAAKLCVRTPGCRQVRL